MNIYWKRAIVGIGQSIIVKPLQVLMSLHLWINFKKLRIFWYLFITIRL